VVATNQRVRHAQRITVGQTMNGWLAVALWVLTFSLGGMVYMQYELNKVWRAPGMRPQDANGAPPRAGDLERAEKLDQLLAAGSLSEDEPAPSASASGCRLPEPQPGNGSRPACHGPGE